MNRRDFLKAIGGTVALAAAGCNEGLSAGKTDAERRPNIIFILVDDLGYGDLGCYGQKEIATPNLDRMAAEGMRFTQHYAGSTVCAPSRCCLMTGYHTGHALIRGNAQVPLRPQDRTVAALLKDAGYATALVGKWGLGEADSTGIPRRQGFDYFFGYLNQVHAHNYYPAYLWRNEERVELPNEVEISQTGYARGVGGVSTNKKVYSHDLLTKEALAFMERNQQNPFFLYLAYTIPHANNEGGRDGMEVPDYGMYADRDWPEAQKGHAAMITRMDGDIGHLFVTLKRLGIDRNTLVLFSSDNGPHMEGGNDPHFNDSNGVLRGIKRDLWEGGIRVPMIARWPGRVPAGTTQQHISAFWDFLPTACEVAGVEPPTGIDGISYLPALLNRPQRAHEVLYWEFHERGSKQAVRAGDWKLIRYGSEGPVELFNLDADVEEEHNVAQQHPEIVGRLTGVMEAQRTSSEHWQLAKEGQKVQWKVQRQREQQARNSQAAK